MFAPLGNLRTYSDTTSQYPLFSKAIVFARALGNFNVPIVMLSRNSIVFTIVFAPQANLPIGNSIVFAPLALLHLINLERAYYSASTVSGAT